MPHTVYLIAQALRKSPERRVYVGYTGIGAQRRLEQYHNRGREPATASGRPWQLGATVEGFVSKGQAKAFESQLQAQSARGLKQKRQQLHNLAGSPRWVYLNLSIMEIDPPVGALLQFSSAALAFNFRHAGNMSFYILTERSIDGPRYHVIFREPQRELGLASEQILEFLAGAVSFPKMISLEYRLDLTGVETTGAHLDRWFCNHVAAGLDESSDLSDRFCRSISDVRGLFETLIHNRRYLRERYQDGERYRDISELRITIAPVGAVNLGYIDGFLTDSGTAGKEQYMQREMFRSVEAEYGDCVPAAIISVARKDRNGWLPQEQRARDYKGPRKAPNIFLPDELCTPDAIRKHCELAHMRGKPLDICHIAQIAKKLVWKQSRNGSERGIKLYLWDLSMNLLWATPPDEIERLEVHIVTKNGHAYLLQNDKVAIPNIARATSLYTAYREARTGQKFEDYIEQQYPDSDFSLTEHKLQLFCQYQHLQPTAAAIDAELQRIIGKRPVLETIELVNHCGNKIWVPKKNVQASQITPSSGLYGQPDKSCAILAEGHQYRCGQVEPPITKTNINDLALCEDRKDDLDAVKPYFPPPKNNFDIKTIISFDLETASLKDGVFKTYAVGYKVGEETEVQIRVAETVEDLRGKLLSDVLDEWAKLADEYNEKWRLSEIERVSMGGIKELCDAYRKLLSPEQKKAKPWKGKDLDALKDLYRQELEDQNLGPGLYPQAYNGGRFDHVEIVHSLLADKREVPQNYMKSNGRIISFDWRKLHFRDICQITMCPLSTACKSYGVETLKGYLPHGYLQRLDSHEEILERLHGTTSWAELKEAGLIDWLNEVSPDDIQVRPLAQPYEEWIQQFEMYKAWEAKQEPFTELRDSEDGTFKFLPKMIRYLESDVNGLHEIVEKVGNYYNDHYGCDIRIQLTLGSLATRIWKGTLKENVSKIVDKQLYERIQTAARGGFCGPLGPFDFKAVGDQHVYKVDVTSLHPAATGCEYLTTGAGDKYFKGFPHPGLLDNPWKIHDFKGAELVVGDLNYHMLAEMNGYVFIEFDQNNMDWPTLHSNLSEGPHSTLTYVLKGSGNYCIPQVLHAVDNGCKVTLRTADYVDRSFKPFPEYMEPLVAQKNACDALKKLLKDSTDPDLPKKERRQARIKILNDYGETARGCIEEIIGQPLSYSAYRGGKEDTLHELCYRSYKGLQLCETRSNEDLLAGADMTRTVTKLLLNALLGRLDMKIDRTQTLLTRTALDSKCLRENYFAYRQVNRTELECRGERWNKVTFREGDFYDHIEKCETAPHLWCTMLGYSKIIMADAFLWLKRNGCTLLYTDTDSIAFGGTEEQYKGFMAVFGSAVKALGSFDPEHKADGYTRLITIGPKKYLVLYDDESGQVIGDWKGNGIQAKQNADTMLRIVDDKGKLVEERPGTMLELFEAVLRGDVCEIDSFRIGPVEMPVHDNQGKRVGTEMTLAHSVDAKKKLRFICLKGRCVEADDGTPLRIEHWADEAEFAAYAKTVKTVLGGRD